MHTTREEDALRLTPAEGALPVWLAVLVVAVFVMLVFAQAQKKYVLDELDFPAVAQAAAESGRPLYYRGEKQPEHLATYHPPLYIHALASYVKVFGFSENSVRAFGALCALATAGLSLLLVAALLPAGALGPWLSPVFLALYLLHPYTIANATLPDIDPTVLPPVLVLFSLGWARMFLRGDGRAAHPAAVRSARALALLAALFALCLWAKLTTPLALLPLIFVLLLLVGCRFLESVRFVAAVAIAGFLLFLVTYWLYCRVVDVPMAFTFDFLVHSLTKGTASTEKGLGALLARVAANFSYSATFAHWITLPFLAAAFVATADQLRNRSGHPGYRLIGVFSAFGLLVTAIYLSMSGAFGGFFKYPYPVFPFVALSVAALIAPALRGNAVAANAAAARSGEPQPGRVARAIPWAVFLVALSAAAGYQFLVGKDAAIRAGTPAAPMLLWTLLGVAVVVGFAKDAWLPLPVLRLLAPAVLGLLLGVEVGISRTQAVASYPTKYSYGQAGMDEAVEYLRARLAPGEPVWSMKDLGFYVGNRYEENYGYFFDPALTDKIAELAREGKIRYFVATTGIGEDRVDAYPKVREALEACCTEERRLGNFVIYRAASR